MMRSAPIISPDAIRDALDLARSCYLSMEHSRRGEAEFDREFDYASVAGAMLSGRLRMWGCSDGVLRAVAALEDDCRVRFLFVEEGYRRHGLGTVLLEALCDCASDEHRTEVFACATEESAAFFHRFGFRACAAAEERYGVSVVPVRLEL